MRLASAADRWSPGGRASEMNLRADFPSAISSALFTASCECSPLSNSWPQALFWCLASGRLLLPEPLRSALCWSLRPCACSRVRRSRFGLRSLSRPWPTWATHRPVPEQRHGLPASVLPQHAGPPLLSSRAQLGSPGGSRASRGSAFASAPVGSRSWSRGARHALPAALTLLARSSAEEVIGFRAGWTGCRSRASARERRRLAALAGSSRRRNWLSQVSWPATRRS